MTLGRLLVLIDAFAGQADISRSRLYRTVEHRSNGHRHHCPVRRIFDHGIRKHYGVRGNR